MANHCTGRPRNRFARTGLLAAACYLALASTGCANVFYAKTGTGTFKGKLTVEWIAPNQFIYRPDKADPLRFTTAAGKLIEPQLMYTDGGSIPRLFWSAPDLGPWDFAPAYIVHDWLFQQHHCETGDWMTYTVQLAATILAQGIKTQMEAASAPEPSVTYAIYEAVKSPVAKKLWDQGACVKPPVAATGSAIGRPATSVVIKRIEIN